MSTVQPLVETGEPARSLVAGALRSNRLLLFGAVIAVSIVVVGIFAPWIAPYPEDAGSATHPAILLQPPSSEHLFGTDQVGRDVFSRVVYGARVSPVIAFLVLLTSIAIGVPLGVLSGYVGGRWDDVIMRITDVFLALPALLLALVFASVLPHRSCRRRWPSPSRGGRGTRACSEARPRRSRGVRTSRARGRSACRTAGSCSATSCRTR